MRLQLLTPARILAPALLALTLMAFTTPLSAQVPDPATTERIKEEGLQRSRALDLFQTLTDVYGARLTGSPEYTAAATWARDQFDSWGLSDARLEPFEFGRGWTLEKLSAEMVAPRYMPLIAYAQAWSPSVDGLVEGRVVYVGNKSARDIEATPDPGAPWASTCRRTRPRRCSSMPGSSRSRTSRSR